MLHWRSEPATAKIVPFANARREFDAAKSIGDILDTMGFSTKFARNAEIFAENDRADHIYKVESGAVRVCKLMSDGRRQIGALSTSPAICSAWKATRCTISPPRRSATAWYG